MAHCTGCRYHPSRITGRAKKEMERASKELKSEKIKPIMNPIILNKPDWSIKSSVK